MVQSLLLQVQALEKQGFLRIELLTWSVKRESVHEAFWQSLSLTRRQAKCVADLKGAKASSQINTVWYDKMIDQVPGVTKLPAIDTVPGLIVALQSGKINLFVTDAPTAQAAEFANKDLVMVEFPAGKGFKASSEDIEIGVAVRKGNNALVEAMNKVLGKMTDKDFKAIMAEAIQKQPLAQ